MKRAISMCMALVLAVGTYACAEEAVDAVGVIKPIPEYGREVSDEPTGEEARKVLPTYETYDPNTGLRDTVPSDATGLLD